MVRAMVSIGNIARALRSAAIPRKRGGAAGGPARGASLASRPVGISGAALRVLIFADSNGPTQKISFIRPLRRAVQAGDAAVCLITEREGFLPDLVDVAWSEFVPTVLVLSRCGGPCAVAFAQRAKAARVPIVYHIDDNLFEVPERLGLSKFTHYNSPQRLADMSALIDAADVVYTSTEELGRQLRDRFPSKAILPGSIYCAARARVEGLSAKGSPLTIGYMGTGGHSHDLALVVPALVALMRARPDVRFEAFGTVAVPADLKCFKGRVAHHPAVADYDAFVERLATLQWHIGLAPLIADRFNACKADTKWVEYTAAGIPVIASNHSVYDRACSGGAGLLVDAEEWFGAIESLLDSVEKRAQLVKTAQARLATDYAPERLEQQLLGVLSFTGTRLPQAAMPSTSVWTPGAAPQP